MTVGTVFWLERLRDTTSFCDRQCTQIGSKLVHWLLHSVVYNHILDIYLKSYFYCPLIDTLLVYKHVLFTNTWFPSLRQQDYICDFTVYHLDLHNRIYPNAQLRVDSVHQNLHGFDLHFLSRFVWFSQSLLRWMNAKEPEFFQKGPN